MEVCSALHFTTCFFLLVILSLGIFADDVEGFLMAPIKKKKNDGAGAAVKVLRPSAQPQQLKKLYYKDDYGLDQHDNSSDSKTCLRVVQETSPQMADPPSAAMTANLPWTSRTRDFPQVYCDLDGVLVDFCKGISEAFDVQLDSHNVDALPRNILWKKVQQRHAFFEHLSWCEGGRDLWNAIAPLKPSILTGVPSYCHRAPREEKFAWCVRELSAERLVSFQLVDMAGPWRQHIPVRRHIKPVRQEDPPVDADDDKETSWSCQVITCWSEQKHYECQPGDILIDDRIDLKRAWEAAGGIFIHHRTGDTAHTLDQLRSHGILPPACGNSIKKP